MFAWNSLSAKTRHVEYSQALWEGHRKAEREERCCVEFSPKHSYCTVFLPKRIGGGAPTAFCVHWPVWFPMILRLRRGNVICYFKKQYSWGKTWQIRKWSFCVDQRSNQQCKKCRELSRPSGKRLRFSRCLTNILLWRILMVISFL